MRLVPPRGVLGAVVTGASHLGVAVRRRVGDRGRLRRPTVSVGNLAFGGRGKTPIVAVLAAHARADGLRPAILIRGYGGARGGPRVAVGEGSRLPAWTAPVRVDGLPRPAHAWAGVLGDEAAWLAATVPGVPVGVSPDRRAAAASLPDVDLFLLDDGAQLPLPADVDIVCVDPRLDRPWSPRPTAQREGPGRLGRAHCVVALDTDPGVSGVSHTLRRRPSLCDATGAAAPAPVEVALIAGVGNPERVAESVRVSGVSRVHRHDLADHASPSRALLDALPSGLPVVVTEKDAVRWAAAWADPRVLILRAPIADTAPLWTSVRAHLDRVSV